ncbi:MAG: cbb3-type cytochrome c oxidase N-terminal domain-containing protein [Bacteroidota bacterium]
MKNKIKYYPLALLLVVVPTLGWAQEAVDVNADPYFYQRFFSNGLFIAAAIVIVGAVSALFSLLNTMIQVQQLKIYEKEGIESFLEAKKQPTESWWKRQYKKWTNVVPIEKEQDILLNHDYDGIKELDNSLPPWWVAMFYLSIGFAVLYMGYYHFTDMGHGSAKEYEIEMQQAEERVQAYLATQANLVDETNAELLTDEQSLAMGKSIYDVSCVSCHGPAGEGGIGPNFTDKYWLHGGDIKDVFKTIKYGVPEKGMISWKAQLRASDMHRVASYILSMQGTNPPNGKEPQGELYEPQATMEADSLGVDEALGMRGGE